MLRKLSRKLSHRPERPANPRQASPEFVSIDAKRIEAQHQTATTPRRSWEEGDESSFYANRGLEALSLEPIIAPTLVRMAPTIAAREALVPPPLRRPEPAHVARQKPPRIPLPVRPHPTDVVILSKPVPGITITPIKEEPDPFEKLDTVNEIQVTSFPVRPILRRQAVSYRTHRDLPLRVQAIRRAHQEEFSRKLADRAPLISAERRGSAPVQSQLPQRAPGPHERQARPNVRPPQPMSPDGMLRRSRSEAQLFQVPQRSHSHSRSPIPDVPPRAPDAEVRDFYIEAAEELWGLPDAAGRAL